MVVSPHLLCRAEESKSAPFWSREVQRQVSPGCGGTDFPLTSPYMLYRYSSMGNEMQMKWSGDNKLQVATKCDSRRQMAANSDD